MVPKESATSAVDSGQQKQSKQHEQALALFKEAEFTYAELQEQVSHLSLSASRQEVPQGKLDAGMQAIEICIALSRHPALSVAPPDQLVTNALSTLVEVALNYSMPERIREEAGTAAVELFASWGNAASLRAMAQDIRLKGNVQILAGNWLVEYLIKEKDLSALVNIQGDDRYLPETRRQAISGAVGVLLNKNALAELLGFAQNRGFTEEFSLACGRALIKNAELGTHQDILFKMATNPVFGYTLQLEAGLKLVGLLASVQDDAMLMGLAVHPEALEQVRTKAGLKLIESLAQKAEHTLLEEVASNINYTLEVRLRAGMELVSIVAGMGDGERLERFSNNPYMHPSVRLKADKEVRRIASSVQTKPASNPLAGDGIAVERPRVPVIEIRTIPATMLPKQTAKGPTSTPSRS